MPHLPTDISSIKLKVSTFEQTFEQEISSASLGNNSIQINQVIKSAFNNSPAGTIFNPSIAVTYSNGLSIVEVSGTPYVPPPPPSFTLANLLARYDASVASSYTLSGSNVTQWNDLTENGHHLIANGTGPTLTTINSLPAFNFNYAHGLVTSDVPKTKKVTVFIIIKYSSNISAYGTYIQHGNRDWDWSIRNSFDWSSLNPSSNLVINSNGDNSSPTLGFVNGLNYIFVARLNDSSREIWRYSDSPTAPTEYASATGTTNALYDSGYTKKIYVGKSEVDEACNGNIGEILYYNESLSDADVSANLLYLRNKWFS
jgi:hypothetical protein